MVFSVMTCDKSQLWTARYVRCLKNYFFDPRVCCRELLLVSEIDQDLAEDDCLRLCKDFMRTDGGKEGIAQIQKSYGMIIVRRESAFVDCCDVTSARELLNVFECVDDDSTYFTLSRL